MIKIPHEFTLAAVIETQRQITGRCNSQYLKVIKDRACKIQQEYIDIRDKIMR